MANSSLPSSFDKLVAESDKPVFVDFWAEWCAPCRAIAPTIKQLAQDYKDRLLVIKVNVDEKPHVASKFGIQSIPTLMLFKNGQVVWKTVGAAPLQAIKTQIEPHL
ncbi:MAG: thioredoxin [Gemmatimonadetes bacterium]|nr:MAG: thioredoxin [Gemmatimonadota bacterium]